MSIIRSVVAGVLFLVPEGCEKAKESHQVEVSGTIGDRNPKDAGQGPGPTIRDSGVKIDDAAKTQDAQNVSDVGEGEREDAGAIIDAGEGEGEGVVGEGEGEGEIPATPHAPRLDLFVDIDSSCSFPSSLSVNHDGQSLLFTCNTPARLYKLPVSGDGTAGDIEQMGADIGNNFTYASHHIVLPDNRVLVTHSSPDGFTLLADGAFLEQTIILNELPQLHQPDSPYISFPNGAALLGEKLCVATSNLDLIDFTTYHDGTVLCFDYVDGQVDPESMTVLITDGKNPTGLATYGEFMVALASNSFAPAEGEQAVLNFFDPESFQNGPIPLGAVTAQVSGQLAVDQSGRAFVGIQLPQNSLAIADLNEGTVSNRDVPITNFISYITLDNDVAILSDNGFLDFSGNPANDTAGKLIFVNSTPDGWQDVLTSELPMGGSLGPSAILGSTLYVAVTARDQDDPGTVDVDESMNLVGSIWKADLSGLR